MSDLVNLVAAVTRDKVVLDLQEENKHLKEENIRLKEAAAISRTVAITGPNRKPVYAEGELDEDGKWADPDERFSHDKHPYNVCIFHIETSVSSGRELKHFCTFTSDRLAE